METFMDSARFKLFEPFLNPFQNRMSDPFIACNNDRNWAK